MAARYSHVRAAWQRTFGGMMATAKPGAESSVSEQDEIRKSEVRRMTSEGPYVDRDDERETDGA